MSNTVSHSHSAPNTLPNLSSLPSLLPHIQYLIIFLQLVTEP